MDPTKLCRMCLAPEDSDKLVSMSDKRGNYVQKVKQLSGLEQSLSKSRLANNLREQLLDADEFFTNYANEYRVESCQSSEKLKNAEVLEISPVDSEVSVAVKNYSTLTAGDIVKWEDFEPEFIVNSTIEPSFKIDLTSLLASPSSKSRLRRASSRRVTWEVCESLEEKKQVEPRVFIRDLTGKFVKFTEQTIKKRRRSMQAEDAGGANLEPGVDAQDTQDEDAGKSKKFDVEYEDVDFDFDSIL